MLFCYSIASLLLRSSVSRNRFRLVYLFVGLLVYFQFLSFPFLPTFQLLIIPSCIFLSLLSIESLNQFHFNHTYNSTFTVQAITFSYFLLVSAIFPSSLLYACIFHTCVSVLRFSTPYFEYVCMCMIHQARFLSDMATKSVVLLSSGVSGHGALLCVAKPRFWKPYTFRRASLLLLLLGNIQKRLK